MWLAAILVISASIVVFGARAVADHRNQQRAVVRVLTNAGFQPFGPTEGNYLTFRSDRVQARLVWERGDFWFAIAPLDDSFPWVSEQVFREALFGEVWDPATTASRRSEEPAFVNRLAQRLDVMIAAMTSADPELRRKLAATQSAQARRLDAYWRNVGQAARQRRAKRGKSDGKSRRVKPPSRFFTYVGPYLAIVAGAVLFVGLLLLDHRHPNRGSEGALGTAMVIIPLAITLYFVIARDWREQLDSSDPDS